MNIYTTEKNREWLNHLYQNERKYRARTVLYWQEGQLLQSLAASGGMSPPHGVFELSTWNFVSNNKAKTHFFIATWNYGTHKSTWSGL